MLATLLNYCSVTLSLKYEQTNLVSLETLFHCSAQVQGLCQLVFVHVWFAEPYLLNQCHWNFRLVK